MNNNITEDYCSFEVSKLLKEKEYNVRGLGWVKRTEKGMEKAGKNANKIFWENQYPLRDNEYHIFYPRPTHALAISWISANYSKDKISYLNYGMTSEEIEKELLSILNCLDKK